MTKRPYFVHLDLLRVLFIFVVLLHHWIEKNPFALLPFGSTIAFVLSGFLLTTPLLEGKKDMPSYWKTTFKFLARRLLRTLPIYLLLLSVYLFRNIQNFRDYSVYFLTFTQNYLIAYNPTNSLEYVQTWSLAVQEQFYIFLPIVIYLLPYKYLRTLFFTFSAAGLLFRIWYFYLGLPFTYNHYTTECCIDFFGIGALISYYHYEHTDKLKKLLSNKLLFGVLILLYACSTFGYFNHVVNSGDTGAAILYNNLYRITERTFVSLLSVWFIGWGIYFPSKGLDKLSSNSIISYLSKISYGIYVYHFFAAAAILKILTYFFNLTPKNIQFSWWVICLNFILTILLSTVSYKIIEKPILQLKDKYFGDHGRKKPAIGRKRTNLVQHFNKQNVDLLVPTAN